MVVDVNRSIRIPARKPETYKAEPIPADQPSSSPSAPRPSLLRSVSRRIWHELVVAFSGPGLNDNQFGIDETQMPSGFSAPYKRGSRQVRNLWHEPF